MNTKGPIFIDNYIVTMCSNTCTLLHLIDKEKKKQNLNNKLYSMHKYTVSTKFHCLYFEALVVVFAQYT